MNDIDSVTEGLAELAESIQNAVVLFNNKIEAGINIKLITANAGLDEDHNHTPLWLGHARASITINDVTTSISTSGE